MEHCLWIKLKYLKPIQRIPGIKQSEKAKYYFLFIFQIGWSIVFQEKGPQPVEGEIWFFSKCFIFTEEFWVQKHAAWKWKFTVWDF